MRCVSSSVIDLVELADDLNRALRKEGGLENFAILCSETAAILSRIKIDPCFVPILMSITNSLEQAAAKPEGSVYYLSPAVDIAYQMAIHAGDGTKDQQAAATKLLTLSQGHLRQSDLEKAVYAAEMALLFAEADSPRFSTSPP